MVLYKHRKITSKRKGVTKMLLELNSNNVRFADLNNFEDGKRLIAGLSQDAFDQLVTMRNVTTTGNQWFEYLVELSMEDQPAIYDPYDNDN